jgi:hypothetical protein
MVSHFELYLNTCARESSIWELWRETECAVRDVIQDACRRNMVRHGLMFCADDTVPSLKWLSPVRAGCKKTAILSVRQQLGDCSTTRIPWICGASFRASGISSQSRDSDPRAQDSSRARVLQGTSQRVPKAPGVSFWGTCYGSSRGATVVLMP